MATPEDTWAAYRATVPPTDAVEEAWNPVEAFAGGLGGGLLGALAGVPADLATDIGLQGLLKLLAADSPAQKDTLRSWR